MDRGKMRRDEGVDAERARHKVVGADSRYVGGKRCEGGQKGWGGQH